MNGYQSPKHATKRIIQAFPTQRAKVLGSKDDALRCIVLAGGAAALESLLTVPVLCPAGIVVVRVVVIASIVVPGIVEASIVVAGIVLTGTEVA